MFDILIKNGCIIDGTGNPWFRGDVGIRNGMIEKVGHLNSDAKEEIDATGLIVCPGFIDSHAHSDFTLLANPMAESKIRQGVTTEVIGNCGLSAAPIKREHLDLLKKYVEALTQEIELDWDWSSMGDYLRRIESHGTSINIVPLVGHGTVRIAVTGFERRVPTVDELEEMKLLVAQACEDGARGLSSGLMYPPGCFADKAELIELLRVVAKYGGIYTSHIRDQSGRLIEAVKEAIEIGEEAGVPVHISHLQAAGMESWGKARNSLQVIGEARTRGIDVTVDVYPYTAARARGN
jgi:N-acyl-D-amino-acid deacylase